MIRHRKVASTNALIAKAVEVCAEKQAPYLVYGSIDYGKKGSTSLADFKRHNGFEKINLPRYYVPLTLKGRIALNSNFHKGLIKRCLNQWWKERCGFDAVFTLLLFAGFERWEGRLHSEYAGLLRQKRTGNAGCGRNLELRRGELFSP